VKPTASGGGPPRSVKGMLDAKKESSVKAAVRPTRKPVKYTVNPDGTVTMTMESFLNAIHSREESEKYEAALEERYKRQNVDPHHYVPGRGYNECPTCKPEAP
jgi:hypothetical protein